MSNIYKILVDLCRPIESTGKYLDRMSSKKLRKYGWTTNHATNYDLLLKLNKGRQIGIGRVHEETIRKLWQRDLDTSIHI